MAPRIAIRELRFLRTRQAVRVLCAEATVENNPRNPQFQGLDPAEAHTCVDGCERTTVVGESKTPVVLDADGVDAILVGVNTRKRAVKVGGRIHDLKSDPELKGPGQQRDVP